MEKRIRPGMMKYCVVGNIVREHVDETGTIRYGTVFFPGGRKVYISRMLGENEVTVMGLNRFKSRYIFESVPLNWIENIRFTRTFTPRVLELMENTTEYEDMWWQYREEDRDGAMKYAELLRRVQGGDREAYERYHREAMERYL